MEAEPAWMQPKQSDQARAPRKWVLNISHGVN